MVYNDSKLNIEASTHIDAQLYEKECCSTVLEDLRKIRETWILCRRLNFEDMNNNSRRARALMMAASVWHMIFRLEDKSEAQAISEDNGGFKDYTYYAWQ